MRRFAILWAAFAVLAFAGCAHVLHESKGGGVEVRDAHPLPALLPYLTNWNETVMRSVSEVMAHLMACHSTHAGGPSSHIWPGGLERAHSQVRINAA